jgi:hypothetical protein
VDGLAATHRAAGALGAISRLVAVALVVGRARGQELDSVGDHLVLGAALAVVSPCR